MHRILQAAFLSGICFAYSLAQASTHSAPAEPERRQHLPLSNGTPVVAETSLVDSAQIRVYFSSTLPTVEHPLGQLFRGVERPGTAAGIAWTPAPSTERVEHLALCKTQLGLRLFALNQAAQLLEREFILQRWRRLTPAPGSAALTCQSGHLNVGGEAGEHWQIALSALDRARAPSWQTPTSSEAQLGAIETSPKRLWSALVSSAKSCARPTDLARQTLYIAGQFAQGRLTQIELSTHRGAGLRQLEGGLFQQCLASTFNSLSQVYVLNGSFDGRLTPPLRAAESIVLSLGERARSVTSLSLDPTYGEGKLKVRARSDLAFLSATVSGSGNERRLYISAPQGGSEFDGIITLETNLKALPQIEIAVHGTRGAGRFEQLRALLPFGATAALQ